MERKEDQRYHPSLIVLRLDIDFPRVALESFHESCGLSEGSISLTVFGCYGIQLASQDYEMSYSL